MNLYDIMRLSETDMIDQEEQKQLCRIVRRIRQQNKAEQSHLRVRVREAHREVERLVAQFREIDPELQKVVLFGSLAHNSIRGTDFDIDLAVKSKQLLKLVACGLRSAFRVDVVDLEKLPAHVRRSIEDHGITIYAKES
jgi:predicted nucleotidyltransferase